MFRTLQIYFISYTLLSCIYSSNKKESNRWYRISLFRGQDTLVMVYFVRDRVLQLSGPDPNLHHEALSSLLFFNIVILLMYWRNVKNIKDKRTFLRENKYLSKTLTNLTDGSVSSIYWVEKLTCFNWLRHIMSIIMSKLSTLLVNRHVYSSRFFPLKTQDKQIYVHVNLIKQVYSQLLYVYISMSLVWNLFYYNVFVKLYHGV